MLIIKGMLVGIGKILPGVSGALIAISLGIYERAINILSNLKKSTIEDYSYILKIIIGVFISILAFSNVIIYLLNINKMITIYFFVGLIVASLNDIKKEITKDKKYITFISFIISIIFCQSLISFNINTESLYTYILIGVIEAITMIIPGISGTAVFIMLGLYNKYLNLISNITMFNFDIVHILLFIIGLVIGSVFTIKVINFLFNKHKSFTYSVIYGITLSSIVLIIVNSFELNTLNIIISILVLYLGYNISKKINQIIG